MTSKKQKNLSNNLYQKNKLSKVNEKLLMFPPNSVFHTAATAQPQPEQARSVPPQPDKMADIQSQIDAITQRLDAMAAAQSQIDAITQRIDAAAQPPTQSLSSKYKIDTNTLFLEYDAAAPAPAATFFIHATEDINRLVIQKLPVATALAPQHYKFKVYIKRVPYSPAVNYINIENLEIGEGLPPPIIVPLNKIGGDGAAAISKNVCIKPSVNSSFIIQEFDIFCEAGEWCAFQTLSER